MTCKYCNSPTCEAERYPDDARLLRICRHNVQLERDFFRNRLRRYEPVNADQPAPTETAPVYACKRCGDSIADGVMCLPCARKVEPQGAPQKPEGER